MKFMQHAMHVSHDCHAGNSAWIDVGIGSCTAVVSGM